MDRLLLAAVALIVTISVAHSYLGERYILKRLFRRDNLPRLFGGDWFTKRTLRFAWHLTSIAWLGLGAIAAALPTGPTTASGSLGLRIIALTFAAHAIVAVVASRGKHLSWLVFGAIAILTWLAAGA